MDWEKYVAAALTVLTGILVPFFMWKFRNYRTPGERALDEIKEVRTTLEKHVQDDVKIQQQLLAGFTSITLGIKRIEDDSREFRKECRANFERVHGRIDAKTDDD